jgi:hypothetical protein
MPAHAFSHDGLHQTIHDRRRHWLVAERTTVGPAGRDRLVHRLLLPGGGASLEQADAGQQVFVVGVGTSTHQPAAARATRA